MGLVRKSNVEDNAPGEGGNADMSTLIRRAVAAEIERQRLETLKRDADLAEADRTEADRAEAGTSDGGR